MYLNTSHSDVNDFMDSCLLGQITQGALDNDATVPAEATPGYARLNYLTNIEGFLSQWTTLFQCVCESLIRSTPELDAPAVLKTVTVDNTDHDLVQQPNERVQLFASRHVTALKTARAHLTRLGQACRTPDRFECGETLIKCCLPQLRARLKDIFIHELNVHESALDFDTVLKALFIAERHEDQSFTMISGFASLDVDSNSESESDGAPDDAPEDSNDVPADVRTRLSSAWLPWLSFNGNALVGHTHSLRSLPL